MDRGWRGVDMEWNGSLGAAAHGDDGGGGGGSAGSADEGVEERQGDLRRHVLEALGRLRADVKLVHGWLRRVHAKRVVGMRADGWMDG